VSSTTVLNRRVHSFELAAERRATRLGRMVNDMATCGKDEREVRCMYFAVIESKRRGEERQWCLQARSGCDVICVCWPRARSSMAHRMIELGRSVPLNTAALLGISVRAYHQHPFLVGESWTGRGGGSSRRSGRITPQTSASSLGLRLNSALSRRLHFTSLRKQPGLSGSKHTYPLTHLGVYCQLIVAICLMLIRNGALDGYASDDDHDQVM
jgi:hypothetical protein